jgi:hypothetical protein
MKSNPIRFYTEDFNSSHAILQKKLVDEGARVGAGECIALLETSKKTIEIMAEIDGHLYWLLSEGDKVANGEIIAISCSKSLSNDEVKKIAKIDSDVNNLSNDISFKASKLCKELGISQAEINDNKIKTDNDVFQYLKKKRGLSVSTLSSHQQNLSLSLMENQYVSFVSVEVERQKIQNKRKELSDKYKIEISLDSMLLLAIRKSMEKFVQVSMWIYNDQCFQDLNKNVGVYITKGIANGVPVELSGKNQNLVELSLSLFEQISAIESGTGLQRLPCSVYLSNLTNTKTKIVIPMLKKSTSSTIVVTMSEDKYLLGILTIEFLKVIMHRPF